MTLVLFLKITFFFWCILSYHMPSEYLDTLKCIFIKITWLKIGSKLVPTADVQSICGKDRSYQKYSCLSLHFSKFLVVGLGPCDCLGQWFVRGSDVSHFQQGQLRDQVSKPPSLCSPEIVTSEVMFPGAVANYGVSSINLSFWVTV